MKQTDKRYRFSRVHKFFVYAILDPRFPGDHRYGHWRFKYLPIYIGKGHDNRHKRSIDTSHNIFKVRKIAHIRAAGLEPMLCVKKDKLTEKQAFDLEIKLIALIGRANLKLGPLTNLTNGGEGATGAIHSEETKARRNASISKSRTPELRARISAALMGIVRPKRNAEYRKNMSIAKKNISDETREKMRLAKLGTKRGPMPESQRLAIGRGNTGKVPSEATRAKISKTLLLRNSS